MADLDRFKRINDERGHQAGDEVLVRFAELAKSAIRQSDWMARFGGEEFVVICRRPSSRAPSSRRRRSARCAAASR